MIEVYRCVSWGGVSLLLQITPRPVKRIIGGIQIRLQMLLLFVSDEKSYTGLIVAVSVAVGVVFIALLLAIVIKKKYWYVHI